MLPDLKEIIVWFFIAGAIMGVLSPFEQPKAHNVPHTSVLRLVR